MNRRTFLRLVGGAAAAPYLAAQAPRSRPNILLILADDLGYGDIGCYGQREIATPNLDRLASEGVRFTDAYAGSTVCAPSRCSLMTGLHTGHASVRGNRSPEAALRPEDVTIPMVLKEAGYRTALIGKWGLGGLGTTGYPTRKGWDEWFGYFSQTHAHNYYPDVLLEGEREYLCRRNFGGMRREYSHDLFVERALSFLERMRGKPQPFFLNLSLTIPHANNELGAATQNGMETPDLGPYAARSWPEPEKAFAAMIWRLDRDVGRIVDRLKALGIHQNTLVLFTSDNGPHAEGGHNADFFRSSGGLRGRKRDLYEGGIRVPAIAWWPGTAPEGSVSRLPWAHWDLLPTFAELAGVAAPAAIDGLSVARALERGQDSLHEYLYWEFHEGTFAQAIRAGRWKAVRTAPDKPLQLYDLDGDVEEKQDVAASQPEVVQQMERRLSSARTEAPDWPVRLPQAADAAGIGPPSAESEAC